jgi:hypothetical protein
MTPHYKPMPPLSRAIEKILTAARQDPLIGEETYRLLEAYVTVAYQRGYDHGQRHRRIIDDLRQ